MRKEEEKEEEEKIHDDDDDDENIYSKHLSSTWQNEWLNLHK